MREMCKRYSVDYIFTFGNADKDGIISSAKWIRKSGEKANNLYFILGKVIDVRPAILKGIDCRNYKRSPGLSQIAEKLEVKTNGSHHDALNDAVLLFGICRKLDIQVV